MKVSVYKSQYVLVVAQHFYEVERLIIQHFKNHGEAADYLEFLATKE